MSVNFLEKITKPRKKIRSYFIPCPANGHRPHFIRHGALHFYSGLIIASKIIVLALLFITFPNAAQFSTVTSSRIVELTNRSRSEAGLPILMHSAILDKSAALKAQDMFAKDYFAHNSPAGATPWEWFKEAGYNYTYAGENLAMNFTEAEEAMTAWLNSPTHKANIMNNNYDEIGIAVAVGKINGRTTTIVVQHFGKSFVTPEQTEPFVTNPPSSAPQVSGATEIGNGKAVEVTFKETKHSLTAEIIYYVQKIFLILLVFIVVNLLLTIFIRIRIQHKPVIIHCLVVIGLGLVAIFFHFHFLESVTGQTITIL